MSPSIAAFLAVSSLISLLALVMSRRSSASAVHLVDSSGRISAPTRVSVQQKPGLIELLFPVSEDARKELGKRLVQAGLYRTNSQPYYIATKVALFSLPVLFGLTANGVGVVTFQQALFVGGVAGGFGMILPSFWLDAQRKKRQTEIRRALPDALDIIVVCVEGGLSLPGAIARVSQELRTAHRTLAVEMLIVQHEIQLGRSTGEALSRLADRFDLDELRSLASVIVQAERFGSSVVKALRVHSESLRIKRRQMAEEKAQKASVKLIFPTVLCIFPALFVVLVGPAVMNIIELFERLNMTQ